MSVLSVSAELAPEPVLGLPRQSASGGPSGLARRLLRLQYWYDRLSDSERLLAGLGAILFLGTIWLYVLGLVSWVLVNRAEEAALSSPATPEQVAIQLQPAPTEPAQPRATAAPTGAVDASGNLIAPPDVPEVPIIPAPPRAAAPVVPIKPRVMATIAPTPAPIATAAPTLAPTRAPAVASPVATPARTGTPLNGSGANGATSSSATATPVRTAAPVATPARTAAPAPAPAPPTPTPTRR